jgi:hypothetical protein
MTLERADTATDLEGADTAKQKGADTATQNFAYVEYKEASTAYFQGV